MSASQNVVPDPTTDGRHAFLCPDCEFVSSGWGTKKAAGERGAQHLEEHETGNAMPELLDSGIKGAMGQVD